MNRVSELVSLERRERLAEHLGVQPPPEDEAGPVQADLDGGVAQLPGKPELLFPPLPPADRQPEIDH